MGFRFRKSIKIAPGVKLNISKSGISTTVGRRGLSANMGKNGAYLNAGLPGTGFSTRTKLDGGGAGAETQEPDYEYEPETVEQTETPKPEIIKDIPTLKKGLRNCYLFAVALSLLGLISLATIILPILFFGGAGLFLLGARQAKKQIRELQAAETA